MSWSRHTATQGGTEIMTVPQHQGLREVEAEIDA